MNIPILAWLHPELTLNDEGDNVAIVGTFRVGSMAGVETWEVDMMIQSD